MLTIYVEVVAGLSSSPVDAVTTAHNLDLEVLYVAGKEQDDGATNSGGATLGTRIPQPLGAAAAVGSAYFLVKM